MTVKKAQPSLRKGHAPGEVEAVVEEYQSLYDEAAGGDIHTRKQNYKTMVTQFYDLVHGTRQKRKRPALSGEMS